MKKRKSAGVENIPAELVQAGGEDVITAVTTICNKIWQTREWPTPWTQPLVITVPKKGNLQQCQNYGTISLISHPSKVMLKIIILLLHQLNIQQAILMEYGVLCKTGHLTHTHTKANSNLRSRVRYQSLFFFFLNKKIYICVRLTANS